MAPSADRPIDLFEQIRDGGRRGTGQVCLSAVFEQAGPLEGGELMSVKVCPAVTLAKGPNGLTQTANTSVEPEIS